MEKSVLSVRKVRRESGFTVIETIVAMLVMTVGLVSVASLISTTVSTSSRSHYKSMAAMLASEKLEDLDRFNANDPNVAAGGSLAADTAGFFDNVQISSSSGGLSETTGTGAGTTVYTQQPGGNIVVTTGGALPAPTPDTLVFDRRWLIAPFPGISSGRQITVFVRLVDSNINSATTYQVTMVRP